MLVEIEKKLNCLFMEYGPLPLRLAAGIIMFAHGAQKMLGWFGGSGFETTAQQFQGMLGGVLPGPILAAMGGGGELFGGLLIFFGLFTRFGAFLVVNTMLVAIFAVHVQNGLFAQNGGFEYPLTLLAVGVSLMATGGGKWSLDRIMPSCCSKKMDTAE